MTPVRLLLLRHAESEWNRLGVWQGTSDPPLTAAGRQHAAEVAARLGTFAAVWSSGLRRAAETATIIAAVAGLRTVRQDDRLGEIHYAAWQGLRAEEIEAGWPGWRAAGQRPDGAESDEDVLARALACLDDIAAGALSAGTDGVNAPVLIVTHGGLMRVVCAHLGAPIDHLGNLGGRWLARTAAGWEVSGTAGALTSAPWTP